MGISTHVLNTALGRPASGVRVALHRMEHEQWSLIGDTTTDLDGRALLLAQRDVSPSPGLYRLRFQTGAYFEVVGETSLYPQIDLHFAVRDGERHYHLPLLLTAHSYTTYRGS